MWNRKVEIIIFINSMLLSLKEILTFCSNLRNYASYTVMASPQTYISIVLFVILWSEWSTLLGFFIILNVYSSSFLTPFSCYFLAYYQRAVGNAHCVSFLYYFHWLNCHCTALKNNSTAITLHFGWRGPIQTQNFHDSYPEL